MSELIKALTQNECLTANGAKTNSTTLNPILDLYFLAGASRELSEQEIISKLSLAFNTNRELTLKLIFWSGDIRQGLGERRFFQICLKWLCTNSLKDFKANIDQVPHFNRWDSLFNFKENFVMDYVYSELIKGNTLLKKWLPRKKQYKNFSGTFRSYKKLTPKQYRKMIVEGNDVVETKLCSKKFDKIEYKKVPSVAFKKYRKSFYRNDLDRITKFIEDVKEGKTTINAGAIFPHDIIKEYMEIRRPDKGLKDSTNAQWSCLPDLMKGCEENILPICDVSGSMGGLPMNVCIALGIYLSERNKGLFKDHFITFSEEPQLQTLRGDVCSRIDQLKNADWGMSTDLISVFRLILDSARSNNLKQEDLPSKMIIFSDMQFNVACENNSLNNFNKIDKMFKDAGYKRPQLIFWNLNGDTSNFPVQVGTAGTALVSGFSPNILKNILSGELEPTKVMLSTLNDERYNTIKVLDK